MADPRVQAEIADQQTQGDSASAIYLIDPVSGNEYIALTDAEGVPLTAAVNASIKPGETYPL